MKRTENLENVLSIGDTVIDESGRKGVVMDLLDTGDFIRIHSENFYKKVSIAYINTRNKYLSLEEKGKIHYLILSDQAKGMTNDGKDINIDNYKEYLDPDFEYDNLNDQIYTSWEELFADHVDEEIAFDIEDLGVEEDGKWNFYISKEDLDILGYEYEEMEELEEDEV